MRKLRSFAGIFLIIAFFAVCFSAPVRSVLTIPEKARMVIGEKSTLDFHLPRLLENILTLQEGLSRSAILASAEEPFLSITAENGRYNITALQEGISKLNVNLWGIIPVKSIEVETVKLKRLIPGGHSIGVILQSNGIMVVGHAPIIDQTGNRVYPAKDQGIEIGDLIFEINGIAVNNENDLAVIIDDNQGEILSVFLKRAGKEKLIKISPAYCSETNRYRIGLYVRDGVVGVGTLSFFDPVSKGYAALGHIILDADTKNGIEVLDGKIVSASVQMIKPGKPGLPGEKIGIFEPEGNIHGNIQKNSYYGIYGIMNETVENPYSTYPLEVAYAHQVLPGKAQIFTVVNGLEIESFDIEIVKVYPDRQNGKNLVLRMTDERLINLTGGIVQGMSGSPIIQNNQLVGAVTHVLLNDPLSGYGVAMDYMLTELP